MSNTSSLNSQIILPDLSQVYPSEQSDYSSQGLPYSVATYPHQKVGNKNLNNYESFPGRHETSQVVDQLINDSINVLFDDLNSLYPFYSQFYQTFNEGQVSQDLSVTERQKGGNFSYENNGFNYKQQDGQVLDYNRVKENEKEKERVGLGKVFRNAFMGSRQSSTGSNVSQQHNLLANINNGGNSFQSNRSEQQKIVQNLKDIEALKLGMERDPQAQPENIDNIYKEIERQQEQLNKLNKKTKGNPNGTEVDGKQKKEKGGKVGKGLGRVGSLDLGTVANSEQSFSQQGNNGSKKQSQQLQVLDKQTSSLPSESPHGNNSTDLFRSDEFSASELAQAQKQGYKDSQQMTQPQQLPLQHLQQQQQLQQSSDNENKSQKAGQDTQQNNLASPKTKASFSFFGRSLKKAMFGAGKDKKKAPQQGQKELGSFDSSKSVTPNVLYQEFIQPQQRNVHGHIINGDENDEDNNDSKIIEEKLQPDNTVEEPFTKQDESAPSISLEATSLDNEVEAAGNDNKQTEGLLRNGALKVLEENEQEMLQQQQDKLQQQTNTQDNFAQGHKNQQLFNQNKIVNDINQEAVMEKQALDTTQATQKDKMGEEAVSKALVLNQQANKINNKHNEVKPGSDSDNKSQDKEIEDDQQSQAMKNSFNKAWQNVLEEKEQQRLKNEQAKNQQVSRQQQQLQQQQMLQQQLQQLQQKQSHQGAGKDQSLTQQAKAQSTMQDEKQQQDLRKQEAANKQLLESKTDRQKQDKSQDKQPQPRSQVNINQQIVPSGSQKLGEPQVKRENLQAGDKSLQQTSQTKVLTPKNINNQQVTLPAQQSAKSTQRQESIKNQKQSQFQPLIENKNFRNIEVETPKHSAQAKNIDSELKSYPQQISNSSALNNSNNNSNNNNSSSNNQNFLSKDQQVTSDGAQIIYVNVETIKSDGKRVQEVMGWRAMPVQKMNEDELAMEKKSLKKLLRSLDDIFEEIHKKAPAKEDKKNLRPLYLRYWQIKRALKRREIKVKSNGHDIKRVKASSTNDKISEKQSDKESDDS